MKHLLRPEMTAGQAKSGLYPVFLHIPLEYINAKKRRQLIANFKNQWANEFVGEDGAGRLWFVFRNRRICEEFQITSLAFFEGILGLKAEQTSAPASAFRYKVSGQKIVLKP